MYSRAYIFVYIFLFLFVRAPVAKVRKCVRALAKHEVMTKTCIRATTFESCFSYRAARATTFEISFVRATVFLHTFSEGSMVNVCPHAGQMRNSFQNMHSRNYLWRPAIVKHNDSERPFCRMHVFCNAWAMLPGDWRAPPRPLARKRNMCIYEYSPNRSHL